MIATSADMAHWWLRTGTPPRRLIQLPLGVDTALFRRRPAARQELGLDDAPLVLGVGRVNRENDFGTLLDGFAQVVSELPRARLHLVGDGPELPALHERAERLRLGNNITWHGWVDRIGLARLYSAADAFAFTALTAGLPRVVLEAMACAAPIVATTVPGVVDHLIDGRTGYLFSPGDADALANKLSLLLRDRGRAAELGAAVGRYAERELSWSTITRRQIDLVYRPLLERARAA